MGNLHLISEVLCEQAMEIFGKSNLSLYLNLLLTCNMAPISFLLELDLDGKNDVHH